MKYIKWGLLSILILLTLTMLLAALVTLAEEWKLSYLKMHNDKKPETNSWIITNVNIIPMNKDTVLMNRMVTIVEGMIEKIDSLPPADPSAVIDAKGAYLMPGLIDMHVHVWDKFELGLYLANGVTTVRNLLGMPHHLKIKKAIETGKLIGPVFYTASPQLTGMEDTDIARRSVRNAEEAKTLVVQYKKQGYDYIKTYNLLPQDIFDAVLEQSVASGIPVVAHPSFKVDYSYHFHPEISTVEHTEDIYQQPLNYTFDEEKLGQVVDGYASSHQTHCPTLSVFYNLTEIYNQGEKLLTSESTRYMNAFISKLSGDYERHMAIKESDRESINRVNAQNKFHIEIVRLLHEARVNIVCGTDAGIVFTPPGFSIFQELNLYKQAGMTDYEALQTATVNPAKVYPDYAAFGTVEAGKMANLILSKKNPLKDLNALQEPEWVMIKGIKIEKPLMDGFKRNALDRKNKLATAIRVVKYVYWDKSQK